MKIKKLTLTLMSVAFLAVAGPVFTAEKNAVQMEAYHGSVNINTASAQQLAEALKGVGESKAQAIVEYREQNGPFTSVEALTAVSGIGEAIYAANASVIEL